MGGSTGGPDMLPDGVPILLDEKENLRKGEGKKKQDPNYAPIAMGHSIVRNDQKKQP